MGANQSSKQQFACAANNLAPSKSHSASNSLRRSQLKLLRKGMSHLIPGAAAAAHATETSLEQAKDKCRFISEHDNQLNCHDQASSHNGRSINHNLESNRGPVGKRADVSNFATIDSDMRNQGAYLVSSSELYDSASGNFNQNNNNRFLSAPTIDQQNCNQINVKQQATLNNKSTSERCNNNNNNINSNNNNNANAQQRLRGTNSTSSSGCQSRSSSLSSSSPIETPPQNKMTGSKTKQHQSMNGTSKHNIPSFRHKSNIQQAGTTTTLTNEADIQDEQQRVKQLSQHRQMLDANPSSPFSPATPSSKQQQQLPYPTDGHSASYTHYSCHDDNKFNRQAAANCWPGSDAGQSYDNELMKRAAGSPQQQPFWLSSSPKSYLNLNGGTNAKTLNNNNNTSANSVSTNQLQCDGNNSINRNKMSNFLSNHSSNGFNSSNAIVGHLLYSNQTNTASKKQANKDQVLLQQQHFNFDSHNNAIKHNQSNGGQLVAMPNSSNGNNINPGNQQQQHQRAISAASATSRLMRRPAHVGGPQSADQSAQISVAPYQLHHQQQCPSAPMSSKYTKPTIQQSSLTKTITLQPQVGHSSAYRNQHNTNNQQLDSLEDHHHHLKLNEATQNSSYYDEIDLQQYQQQQQQIDDLEHYYSRNLHLLDLKQQQAQFTSPDFEFNQFTNYTNNGNKTIAGHLSAPVQRRFKWPKQQYQYLSTNHDNSSSPIELSPTYAIPGTETLQTSQIIENYSNNYNLDYGTDPLALVNGRRRRKSTGSNKLKNPFASLFQPLINSNSNQTVSVSKNKNHNYQQYSHTIHLSSSKSHQALNSSSTLGKAASNLLPNSGSLKRIKSSPLAAQQATYEAMRTIDMYLIRQIARSCRDFEMEQKIELEIRLRELAAQSMLEARTEIEVLEVEKSLLTSDQRMNCYASQLEEQRKQLSNPSLSTVDSGRGSKIGGYTTTSSNQLHPGSVSPNDNQSDQQQQQPQVAHRSDVIGQTSIQSRGGCEATSSPSCSSLSNSQSPSKLSPVSGESANSAPSFSSGRQQVPSNQTSRSRLSHLVVSRQNTASRNVNDNGNQNNHNNSTNSASNTLNRRHKARNKRREHLMQKITSQSNINCNMVVQNRATLCISELRIPLMWRDVDHFKGRGDYKRYAVFCLLKINSQIYDTQLISNVDRQMTDLTFDDLIVFHDVEHEFELTLEVYSCVYLEQFSFSSTPRKLKEKLSSSVSRAMGRRLTTQTASTNYTKELQAYDKSYRFAMIASAKLRLDDATDQVKTYDLVLVTPSAHHRLSVASAMNQYLYSNKDNSSNSSTLANNNNNYYYQNNPAMVTTSNQKDAHRNTLPLFGHFCCKLLVRPDCFDKNVKTGYLRVASINLNTLNQLNGASCGQAISRSQPLGGSRHSDSLAGSASYNSDQPSAMANNDLSMLRSALAASSKLANLSMANSTVHWALLRNFVLHLWPIDEQKLELALIRGHAPQVDVSRRPPFSMAVDKFTKLLRVSNSSLTIETDKGCFVLAVYNPSNTAAAQIAASDEIGQWLRSIEQMVFDSHIWGSILNHYAPKQHRSLENCVQQSASGGMSTSRSKQQHRSGFHNSDEVLQADF